MSFTALFFLCVRMFHFINANRLSYFLQRFAKIMAERKAHPDKRQIIVVDGSSSLLLVYLLCDLLFLLYCMWLMLHDATWTPGFLLLVIAAMEPLAVHSRISGTFVTDVHGFVYPSAWFRYLTFGESMFILLRLFEG